MKTAFSLIAFFSLLPASKGGASIGLSLGGLPDWKPIVIPPRPSPTPRPTPSPTPSPTIPKTCIPNEEQLHAAIAAYHGDRGSDANLLSVDQYGPIEEWCFEPEVRSMDYAFQSHPVFNADISKWDVSNVVSMRFMFATCVLFNQPLNDWAVSNVKTMNGMFLYAQAFNQPLNK